MKMPLIRITAILLFVASIEAQQVKSGDRLRVKIETAATASEQLLHCEKLMRRVRSLPADQRIVPALELFANLDVVAKAWPGDQQAILQSYLLKAEAGRISGMISNAREVLTRAEPLARNTKYRPLVEQHLAELHDRLGEHGAAEEKFAAAERSLRTTDVTALEAGSVLAAAAGFHHRQGRPRDAMRCYRAAANWKGQSGVARSNYLLASFKESLELRDDPSRAEARRDAEQTAVAIATARKGIAHADDQSILGALEAELRRLREHHRLH